MDTVVIDGYTVPIVPDLHKKVYEAASKPGALYMWRWHACDTTHCRAGWVVTLAGKVGLDLEHACNSTSTAAALIYRASCPGYEINILRFHDYETDALTDMKRLAEAE